MSNMAVAHTNMEPALMVLQVPVPHKELGKQVCGSSHHAGTPVRCSNLPPTRKLVSCSWDPTCRCARAFGLQVPPVRHTAKVYISNLTTDRAFSEVEVLHLGVYTQVQEPKVLDTGRMAARALPALVGTAEYNAGSLTTGM